ncbi:hypothetical protein [Haloferula sp. A504]|uniref:hypothetical protein n=1 Tax=Haloferula sp. A504 TaxID=3373601 RepID=UPI0031CB4AF7|nr:hypothetical protein [Verrucomicrobiaceae bacterium E54]
MRRLLASVLLLCVGFSLPAVGGPVCLCVADLIHGQSCCGDCCDDHGCDCAGGCPKIEELPDAAVPGPTPEVPPVPVTDLADLPETMVVPPLVSSAGALSRAESIRGPTTGPPSRAVLAIWRL